MVVIAGALLQAVEKLLTRGIHPTAISESFQRAAVHAVNVSSSSFCFVIDLEFFFVLQILTSISTPVQLDNREQLIKSASTSLNSKVVYQQSSQLGPLAVDAVLKIVEPGNLLHGAKPRYLMRVYSILYKVVRVRWIFLILK